MATNYSVGTQAALASAIAAINSGASGSYTITFTANITLASALPALTYGSGTTVTIAGGSFALDGADTYAGLTDQNGALTISNLTIRNMLAEGGTSLGGGLTLGGTASAALSNVTFDNDQAVVTGSNNAGGDVYVQAGGALTIDQATFLSGGGQAGTGGYAAGILIQGANTVMITPAASQVVTLSDVIGDTAQSGAITIGGGLGSVVSTTVANTYTGATTINSGTLALNGAGDVSLSYNVALASSSSTLDISGANGSRTANYLSGVAGSNVLLGSNTLTENDANADTFAGVVSGAGGLTKTGAGTLTLSGVNTYNGVTTVAAGTLLLFGGGSIADSSDVDLTGGNLDLQHVTSSSVSLNGLTGQAGTTVALGTTDLIIGALSTTFAGSLAGAGGALTIAGGGTLTLSGTNSYTGATTINNGSVAIAGAGSIAASSSVDLAEGSAGLDISGAGSAVTVNDLTGVSGSTITLGANTLDEISNASTGVASNITGTGGLSVSGTGTLGLSNYNNYTGATTIGAGTLAIVSGGSVASSSGVDIGNATGTFDISSASNGQQIKDLNGVAGSQVTLGGNTLVVQSTGTDTFAGTIGGSGQLQQSGTGTLILTGTNSYTGNTTINSGTIQVGAGGTTGTILGAVTDDGTLSFDLSDAVAFAGNITGAGNLVQRGTGTTTLTGDNRYSGSTTVSAGILQIGAGGTTGDLFSNVSVAAAAQLAFDRSDSVSYYEVISGAGSVADTGTGTLIMTAANTYTGGTTIGSGTLELSGATGAGTGTISFTSGDKGTLRLDAGTPANLIEGFTTGDTIDLRSVGQVTSAKLSGTVLVLSGVKGVVNIKLDPTSVNVGETFSVKTDGAGGTDITVANAGTEALKINATGTASQYTVYSNSDGSLQVVDTVDTVADRDGTKTLATSGEIQFSNGVGLADPTGLVGDVARLYQAAFDRTPDLTGLQYWSGQALDNVPLSSIASAFASSAEFVKDYGALSKTAFVQTLYQNVLDRAGDATGIAFWVGQLNGGASEGSVLNSFAQSAENKAATISLSGDPSTAEAYRLYRAALDRTPDTTGLDYWAGALAGGESAVQVAQSFVSSSEFQADYKGLSNNAFVQKLYENVLNRAGDATGIAYWTNALNTGASKGAVVQLFADSAENRADTAAATHSGWVFVASS